MGKRRKPNIETSKSWNLWDYLYYRVTLFYSKAESKLGFDDNKRRGSQFTALFIGLNVQSLLMLILTLLFNKNEFLLNYMGFIFIGLLLIILVYSIYYFEKKKHKLIFEKYNKETDKQKKDRGYMLNMYFAITIISLFVVVFIGRTLWI